MAWRTIGTDGFITVFSIDSEADVPNLPTNVGQGSAAVCVESADGSGIGQVTYMLDSKGQWKK